jgi:excisionase family DNA binding protein
MKRRKSDVYLTRIEAATRLGVSPMTLIRWEYSGRLVAIRFGRNLVRYRVEDLVRLEQEALASAGG